MALRQKLNGPNLDTLRNAIEKLGANASDWFDAFGVGANMLGALGTIATTLGAGNLAWIQNVPLANRSVTASRAHTGRSHAGRARTRPH